MAGKNKAHLCATCNSFTAPSPEAIEAHQKIAHPTKTPAKKVAAKKSTRAKTTTKPSKGGRPTLYTQKLADKLCAELAIGRSLRSVVKDKGMPDASTFFGWIRKHPEFHKQYARAKEESADALAEDIQDIADRVLEGRVDPNAGRVAGDLKKWTASKLKPKKYGDKLDMTSDGEKLGVTFINDVPRPKKRKSS